jgi:DHA1 family multidrug resistance protein-like MFS transporter
MNSFYTFVVYGGSSIYVPSEEGVMQAFGVGIPKASMGLAIYVLGCKISKLLSY